MIESTAADKVPIHWTLWVQTHDRVHSERPQANTASGNVESVQRLPVDSHVAEVELEHGAQVGYEIIPDTSLHVPTRIHVPCSISNGRGKARSEVKRDRRNFLREHR